MTTVRKLILAGAAACAAAAVALVLLRDPVPETKMVPFMVPEAAVAAAAAAPGGGGSGVTAAQGRTPGQPPVLFEAAPFKYVDQEGRPSGDAQLRGRVWIANFIFTNCAGSCPVVTGKMVQLQKELNDPDVRFVSFSVDPDRDDPHTLKKYGAANHPGEQRWLLLRPPDRKSIVQLAMRMAAIGRAREVEDTIVHTDFFLLIDAQGNVRGHYDSKQPAEMERLKADALALVSRRAAGHAPPAGPRAQTH